MKGLQATPSNDGDTRYAVFCLDGEGYTQTDYTTLDGETISTHTYDVFSSGGVTLNGEGERLYFSDAIRLIKEQAFSAYHNGYVPLFFCYFGNYDFTQLVRGFDDFELTLLNNRADRTRELPKQAPRRKTGETEEEYTNRLRDFKRKSIVQRYKKPATITQAVAIDTGDKFSPERYKIDYLDSKYWSLSFPIPASLPRAQRKGDESLIQWLNVRVQDVGTVFGGSFVKALEDFEVPMTKREHAQLVSGKANRAIHCSRQERLDTVREVITYNQLELSLMFRLICQLDKVLQAMGWTEFDWDKDLSGIGSMAGKFLKLQAANNDHILRGYEVVNLVGPEVYEAANSSYFGGWSETFKPGLREKTYGYDITSAYPHAMRALPCLKEAAVSECHSFKQARAAVKKGCPVLVSFAYESTNDRMGPLPFRTEKQTVSRPIVGEGWYWMTEAMAAENAGLLELDEDFFNAGWIITPQCECHPLKYVEDLFYERISVGKKSAVGQMMKIIMNAQYGKMCQSVGNPAYSNAIYASLITSACRTQILEAIATHPRGYEAVIHIATDAVYFDSPHPELDLTPNTLGCWEESRYDKAWFLKPGIWGGMAEDYETEDDREWSVKTRGISHKAFVEHLESVILPKLEEARETKVWPEEFSFDTVESFSMVTIGEAIARGQAESAGEFVMGQFGIPEKARSVSFSLSPKRAEVLWDEDAQEFVSTTAIIPALRPVSVSYDKLIGDVKL